MKVDLDPRFSVCFVEHDKDEHLEISIEENGTISFFDSFSTRSPLGGIPLSVEFTSEELLWLACNAKAFKIARAIYKGVKYE